MLTSLINNFKVKFKNDNTDVFKHDKSCYKLPDMKPDTFERNFKPVKEVSFAGKPSIHAEEIEKLLKQTIERIISEPEPEKKYNIWIKTAVEIESTINKLFNLEEKSQTPKSKSKAAAKIEIILNKLFNLEKRKKAAREDKEVFVRVLKHEQRPSLANIQTPLSKAKRKFSTPVPLPENYKEIYEKEAAELVNIYKRYQFFIKSGLYKSNKGLPVIFGLAMDLIKGKTKTLEIEGDELLKNTKLNLKNTEIYTILSNISQNAAKYSKNKGDIKIRFELEKSADGRDMLNFSVQDNGIGIPKDQLKTVLEGIRASNTEDFQGTGFGLHLVNKILKKAGSEVMIESELGKGTKITCPIPISAVPKW
ncbi:MAG TPA: hypothetical protein DDW90_10575 [Cyanobacteria bacterium UBA9971]|nr:hypothetical protein [Cyanobacteria bacterium UBA9971]